MWSLALETSSAQGSVALARNSTIIAQRSWVRTRGHSEFLLPAVQEILSETKIKLRDVKQVAVGVGPGSFTGIRAGVNFARSLAYANSIPAISVSSLEILCSQVREGLAPLALINAFKNRVYAWSPGFASIKTWSLHELNQEIQKNYLCLGDGYSLLSESAHSSALKYLSRDSNYGDAPTARSLVEMIRQSPQSHSSCDWNKVEPLYITESSAEENI